MKTPLPFYGKLLLSGLLMACTIGRVEAQDIDTLQASNLETVVVTATRSERQMGALPMPVSVVSKQQIRQMGSLRLGDVLAEQTGLFLVNDHGTGVQVQGFSPDYTLILVDGEPLVGRTAGTLELSRLAVGNIKQIEIVKGPSSSLYGSEALAGVINIITDNPNRTRADVSARYGGNRTADLTANGSLRVGKVGLTLFGNRYSSGGYDLTPEILGSTVSPFHNFTIQPKLSLYLSKRSKLTLSQRYFDERQQNRFALASEGGTAPMVAGEGRVSDANYTATYAYKLRDHLRLNFRLYHTQYRTQTQLSYETDGRVYDDTYFRQTFTRPEVQGEWSLNEKNLLNFGVGHIAESVEATRYEQRQSFQTNYAFFQYELFPKEGLHIILGGRYDAHSAYRNQLSPKLSVSYQLTDKLLLRASAAVGFKAPDFRQLYLNFNNAVAGYSVFGAQELAASLARLQANGQILDLLADPANFGALRPESSRAVNLGLQYSPAEASKISLNLFRNDVRDLIETQPVARKINGQSVFSYLNLNRVFTQGAELELSQRWQTEKAQFTLSGGYQFLEAKDKAILEKIAAGNVFRRDPETLVTERVTRRDYGGLMGRSRHSANVKLFYTDRNGFSASLRGIYRGRYGFGDRNSNSVLDAANEYVKGYMLWNVTTGKKLGAFSVQAGVDNLLNFKNPAFIPAQPGRLGWVRVSANLEKNPKKNP